MNANSGDDEKTHYSCRPVEENPVKPADQRKTALIEQILQSPNRAASHVSKEDPECANRAQAIDRRNLLHELVLRGHPDVSPDCPATQSGQPNSTTYQSASGHKMPNNQDTTRLLRHQRVPQMHTRPICAPQVRKCEGKGIIFVLSAGSVVAALSLYVAYAVKEYRWPRNEVVRIYRTFIPRESGNDSYYARFGRLDKYPTKTRIPCPKSDTSTAVILAIGQSNLANQSEHQFASDYATKIVNYYNGDCYPAGSPLLGSTGDAGEPLTLLANKLVAGHFFQQVILIPAAIGGSSMHEWQLGGKLNQMMLDVIDQVQAHYRITHVVWHQGESDFVSKTTTSDYVRMFQSMIASIRMHGVDASVFVSIATMCKEVATWNANNSVAIAQRAVVDPAADIYPGPDTDALLIDADRYDGCHLTRSGQVKLADGLLEAITRANRLAEYRSKINNASR